MFDMYIAHGNTAIEALCYSIAPARITNSILYVSSFYNSTLNRHNNGLYFVLRRRKRRKVAITPANDN